MDPGGLRQGKVRSQEVTTSTLDTPSTFRSISPENSAQIFTHLGWFCMRVVDLNQDRRHRSARRSSVQVARNQEYFNHEAWRGTLQ
eukprot:COSAG06_NODE_381_length_16594_cov_7.199454_4_plen_86_part_00